MSRKHGNSTQVVEATDDILTIPNVISFIRLCLVPAFLVALLKGQDFVAAVLFAVAAATDFVDGQIARRTKTVSKLGQLLDPAVDRCLMIFGVIGLLAMGRLPIWIVVFVVVRDLYLLIGGMYLLRRFKRRVPVILLGKIATTCLFVGFVGLVLNMPLVPGLGFLEVSWLPGFNSGLCCWGIWFVYAGLLFATYSTIYYTVQAWHARCQVLEEERNVARKVAE